jgi:hypothetical protein
MPLMKSILAQELEDIFNRRASSSAEAARLWSKAYVSYASGGLSKAGSLPTNAQANLGILIGAFTAAFNSLISATAATLMAQGVMTYWQGIVWAGPVASGATAVPGNFNLSASLSAVFVDLSKKTNSQKASELADTFDVGAKMVVVSDIPFVQPAPPIVGPIS